MVLPDPLDPTITPIFHSSGIIISPWKCSVISGIL
nr:MAG TPA: hypothetical protein [Caudoviricetes sp.]